MPNRLVGKVTLMSDERKRQEFDVFVRQYQRPVYGRVRKRLGETEAWDVTQDVFIRLWEYWDRINDKNRRPAYLWRIVISKISKNLRDRRRRKLVLTDMEDQETDLPNPEDALWRLADANAVRRALENPYTGGCKLTPLERETAELRYLDGWPHAEIGAKQRRSENAVKTMCHRLRPRLQARITCEISFGGMSGEDLTTLMAEVRRKPQEALSQPGVQNAIIDLHHYYRYCYTEEQALRMGELGPDSFSADPAELEKETLEACEVILECVLKRTTKPKGVN